MPYIIEFIANTEKVYQCLEKACALLNDVQSEFEFRPVPKSLRNSAFHFKQDLYDSKKLLFWLKDFKVDAASNRQFMILAIDGPFVNNLFGNAIVADGVAVFTIHSSERYVSDIIRFCRYYLVRYALGFFAPEIRNHLETKSCLFDKKNYKPDIINSFKEAKICDQCREQMVSRFKFENSDAIEKLLKLVSDQYPRALIMKGGGVKGLAYTGAISELQKYFVFDTFVGTSAGAIAAVLLGAGYTAEELTTEMKSKSFKDFKDVGVLQGLYNSFRYGGWYTGTNFKEWITGLLTKKISQAGEIRLLHLPYRTVMYACSELESTITFDSTNINRDAIAAFATRCSMSIPGFFVPVSLNDDKVFDGGIVHNFPLGYFHNDNSDKPFIALYLESKTKIRKLIPRKLYNIVTERDEKTIVDKYPDRVVRIDTHNIKTTDFNLTDKKKDFLITSGRVSALKFLKKHYPESKISDDELGKLSKELEVLRCNI